MILLVSTAEGTENVLTWYITNLLPNLYTKHNNIVPLRAHAKLPSMLVVLISLMEYDCEAPPTSGQFVAGFRTCKPSKYEADTNLAGKNFRISEFESLWPN